MKPQGNPLLAFFVEFPDRVFGWLPRILQGLRVLLEWILEAFRHFRIGRLLTLAGLAALVLAAVQIVPPVYGRFALAQEATTAARRASALGEEVVLRKLTSAAFKLGYTEVALAPDTFKLEYSQEDGVNLATVSYDFVHEIDLYGVARLPLRVENRVVAPTMAKLPSNDPEKAVE